MESPVNSQTVKRTGLKLQELEHLLPASTSPDADPADSRKWILGIFLACFCEQLRVLPFAAPEIPDNDEAPRILQAYLERLSGSLACGLFCPNLPALRQLKNGAIKNIVEQMRRAAQGLTLEDLIYICEFYLAPASLNLEGTFYTPQTIARRIARDTVDSFLDQPGKCDFPGARVLDPACGGGIFLLEAYRYLCEKLSSRFPSRALLMSRCIYGVDKDPGAVELSRLVLTLALLQEEQMELFYEQHIPDLKANIICANSLLDDADFDPDSQSEQELKVSLNAISWHAAFPGVFAKKGFDVVIGNPPYGLSRDEQIGKKENEKLKAVYSEFRHGKINKYLAFMAKGFDLLSPRGVLSYIVPNAWLGIDGGAAVRKLFLASGALRKVVAFNCPVFGGLSVEPVIFQAFKAGLEESISVHHTAAVDFVPSRPVFEIPIRRCLARSSSTIPLIWSAPAGDALDCIQSNSIPLGDSASGFTPLIALQAYAQGKGNPPQGLQASRDRVFHTRSCEDSSTLPYLEGSDVERYFVRWSGEYLKFGPWLAEFPPAERFQGPRIVLREIIRPAPYLLSAAFLKETFLYNRSVLHILPSPQTPEVQVLALLGVLNSRLASFIIRLNGRKSQRRVFPKIVNADLRDFPLPRSFPQHTQDLFKLSQKMCDFVKVASKETQVSLLSGLAENSAYKSPEIVELQAELDAAVFAAYGLGPEQVNAIEDILGL